PFSVIRGFPDPPLVLRISHVSRDDRPGSSVETADAVGIPTEHVFMRQHLGLLADSVTGSDALEAAEDAIRCGHTMRVLTQYSPPAASFKRPLAPERFLRQLCTVSLRALTFVVTLSLTPPTLLGQTAIPNTPAGNALRAWLDASGGVPPYVPGGLHHPQLVQLPPDDRGVRPGQRGGQRAATRRVLSPPPQHPCHDRVRYARCCGGQSNQH